MPSCKKCAVERGKRWRKNQPALDIGNRRPRFSCTAVAVQQSLENADFLGKASAPYALRANLLRIDQPLIGLDFEVTSEVEYALVEVASNQVIVREVIRTPFTAGVGDAFIAIKRLRLANEGAARVNIESFLKRLSAPKIETARAH
jgi:hypothetical protein